MDIMETRIRILTQNDAAVYRELRLMSYRVSPLAFSESYEDEVKRTVADFGDELKTLGEPAEWFVMGIFSDRGQLLGFVKFRRDQRRKARHKSMIHAMYIDPGFRGFGLGKNLLTALLSYVGQLEGLEQIHLWVLHADTSASGFYQKCGFESQGTLVKKDLKINGVYVDAEYMVKYLDQR